MAIGMKMGRRDPNDKEHLANVYSVCREFWSLFEKEFGSNLCYDLTGVHLDDEEERQEWLASGGLEKCSKVVEKVAQMLWELIDKIERKKEEATMPH